MRIAIDLTSLSGNRSGFERFADNIAYQLVRQDSTNQFILVFQGVVPARFRELASQGNVELAVMPQRGKLRFRLFTLPIGLHRIQADRWLFPAFPPPLAFARKDTFTAIHDLCCWDCPETMTAIGRIRFRLLYRKAKLHGDRIITVSEFSKDRIHKILDIPREKIAVVHNGVDESFFRWKEREHESDRVRKRYRLPERYILCLSTVEPRKNMKLLVKACSELWQEGALDAGLVIAGRDGWKTQTLLDGVPQDCLRRIRLTGFVQDGDLPLLYHMAQVFAFPSLYEGFGIPPLEALAAGTAVISSDAAAMKEILGENALYFANNDLADLKRCIRDAMAAKPTGDPAAARQYTWESAAEALGKALAS